MQPSRKKGPIAWMAAHTVTANLLMLTCIIGGYLMLTQINQEVFPEYNMNRVQVTVAYPGASPEETETGIVLAIEEAVNGLDGVRSVDATAAEGAAIVTIEAQTDFDVQQLGQDVKAEVDRLRTLPVDAERPEVRVLMHQHSEMSLVLYGDTEERSLHELAEQLRDGLLQYSEITQVELVGVRPLEVSIEISQENLQRYKLTMDDVARRLRSAVIDMPGGALKTSGGEILIRMKERRDFGDQFARLPLITTADGNAVLLEQIATVVDGYEDSDYSATYNGKRAIMLSVYSESGDTPVEISTLVRKHLAEASVSLPEGIAVDVRRDRSEILAQRINLLLRNSAIGLVLVLVLLALFLEIRLAFWVMMGIPISFLGAFLLLPELGVSINMISLFAFIVALGIVVDDAIIVGENIYHHRQEGMEPLQAAITGAREMAVPVTFSILTNIAAFMPLMFIPGMMGKIFFVIPIVVGVVFVISLVESLFILPAHLAALKHKQRQGISLWLHQKQQHFSANFRLWIRVRYGSFLDLALRYRYLTVTIAISLLIVTISYAMSGRMGMVLFPKMESDYAKATVLMPVGAPAEHMQKVAKRLLDSARKVADETGQADELVRGIFTQFGRSGGDELTMTVYMAAPDVRDRILGVGEFTQRWRQLSGEFTDIESLLFESDAGGPGAGRGLNVELNHWDVHILEQASRELAETIQAYPQAKDVDDGFTAGKRQLDFAVLPEGKSLGLTAEDIARQVRHAFYGAEVLRQQRGRNEIKIMVRLPEQQRISEQNIHDLLIKTPAGTYVPLRDVVSTKQGHSFTKISRSNGRRVIKVESNISPRSKAVEIINDLEAGVLPELVSKYPGLRYSFQGRQADMSESLGGLKYGFLLAMLAIYLLLAIPLQSYSEPLIVMLTIPFGVIGAIFGHLIMGYGLSVVSMLGIVALAGIVINDSLILINHANGLKNKDETLSEWEVIRAAGIQRFRPIVLTTVTTFGGLTPMIFETSRQAKMLIPMAISLGFGILFATFITLILVPTVFLVLNDVRKLLIPKEKTASALE
jgi:multidrug efflux pump subunit AcrB